MVGDDILALQCVLENDTVRGSLVAEEASINRKLAEGISARLSVVKVPLGLIAAHCQQPWLLPFGLIGLACVCLHRN